MAGKVRKASARRDSSSRSTAKVSSKRPSRGSQTVRVKTFIVEKPVYVRAPAGDVPPWVSRGGKNYEKEPVYDSKRSKYAKRKALVESGAMTGRGPGDLESEEVEREEQGLDTNYPEEPEAELPEETGEGTEGADAGELEGSGELSDEELEGGETPKTHVRSRAMFMSVWWKRAILWGFLAWLIILGVEFVMQAMKLVEVDLTRQWWVLLAILIVVSLVWQRFFGEKNKK